jgi:hypothetical protein
MRTKFFREGFRYLLNHVSSEINTEFRQALGRAPDYMMA